MDRHFFYADPDPDLTRAFTAILIKDNKRTVTPDLMCTSFIGCGLYVGGILSKSTQESGGGTDPDDRKRTLVARILHS